jgi:hypothetical protein
LLLFFAVASSFNLSISTNTIAAAARRRQQQAASVANDKIFEEEDSNHGLVCMYREW